jgi:hypothetical protein
MYCTLVGLCTASVLPLYYLCVTSALPLYYLSHHLSYTSYYTCTVLPLYYLCTISVLPLYYISVIFALPQYYIITPVPPPCITSFLPLFSLSFTCSISLYLYRMGEVGTILAIFVTSGLKAKPTFVIIVQSTKNVNLFLQTHLALLGHTY